MSKEKLEVNDVVQIIETFHRKGWIGAFVLVTEVFEWGVQGFVHHIDTHDQSGKAYIRLPSDTVEYIGPAVLAPKEEA